MCYDGYVSSAADLIVDFVNTLDISTGNDRLANTAGLASWLRYVGLEPTNVPVSERDRHIAVELREHLRTSLGAHHEGTDDTTALDAIAAITSVRPLGLRFTNGIAELASAQRGVGTLVAAIAGAIVTLQHDQQWFRVRICPSSDCLEAFHDQSRGGTRRWCSMEVCGNRSKVGAYRHRTSRAPRR
jgi:predicted RNA-binding Zn ribbon-like protein